MGMKWRGSNPLEQNAPVTSLQQELAERRAMIEKYVPEETRALNRRAVEFGIRTALALHCSVAPMSRLARKNYFYPDLPKGYQISQYESPFCQNGFLEIPGDDGRPYAVGRRQSSKD